jgi:hypothetical protein
MATDFLDRSDAVEECYEFMLAYAGQGLLEKAAKSEDTSSKRLQPFPA